MNTDIRQRLLEMEEEDRRVRAELSATGELFQGYSPEMEEVHRRNAEELELMIEQYGWPGKSLDIGVNHESDLRGADSSEHA